MRDLINERYLSVIFEICESNGSGICVLAGRPRGAALFLILAAVMIFVVIIVAIGNMENK